MPKRKQSEWDFYHVVARGTGKQIIFEDDSDKHLLHALLHKLLHENHVEVYAWCFMENHIHLLLRAPLEHISAALKCTLQTYAIAFNRKYQRQGHLFQEAFRSEPIEDESHLLSAIRYIHQNPLKAGLTNSCHWPWSSFDEYYGTSTLPSICAKRSVLELFGGLEWFLSFHEIDCTESCLDVTSNFQRSKTRAMPDAEALVVAERAIGAGSIEVIKAWPRDKRNAGIVSLHDAGLTIRQIERLTGISRGAINHTLKTCQMMG